MNKLLKNSRAFANLVPMVLVVIIAFAMIFIGTFVNGSISEALTDTYADNEATGSVDAYYYHNATTDTYRNITLPTYCTAGELTAATTYFAINANETGTNITYNLTTNGHITYTNQTVNYTASPPWHNTTLTTLIANGNVSNSNTYLNFSWEVNLSANRIVIRTVGTYFQPSDYRNPIENSTVNTLNNKAKNWDSTLDIVQVVIIITVLAAAIGAIFLFTRFR